jgi:hypothetical protein
MKPKTLSEYEPKEKAIKPKTKKHSIGWIGRNIFHIQEPMGQEGKW